MVYKSLIDFVIEAQSRGFNEYQITAPLIREGWSLKDIEKALEHVKKAKQGQRIKTKMDVFLELDSEVVGILERRAKRNKMTLKEQMQDILRRSAINNTASGEDEKLDDRLVGIFSRKDAKKSSK